MVPGGTTSGTHIANDLALGHRLTHGNSPLRLVRIEGPGAVAVGDDHIVTIGGTIGRDHDYAALGGHDGRSAGSGHVTAAVELLPVEGAVPVTERRRDPGVPGQRPQEPAGAGTAATAGGGRAAAVTATRLAFRGLFLRLFGFLGLPLGFKLRLIVLLRLGNLAGNGSGVILQLVHLLGIHARLAFDLRDHRVYVGLLRFQFRLLAFQIRLSSLLGSLVLLQICLGICHSLTGGSQVVHHLVVIVHDFRNGVDLVQQVRKAVGIEENGPIGHIPPLLHAADSLVELLLVLGFFLLGFCQFHFLLVDHLAVILDGLLRESNLLLEYVDLLFQQELLV